MAARRKKEKILGLYFGWLIGTRGGMYYADGRSNRRDAGRHSLSTRDRAEALEALRRLDLVVAVRLGLADPGSLNSQPAEAVTLEDGRRRYEAHAARPRVTG